MTSKEWHGSVKTSPNSDPG